ncbi:flagellar hook-length control protein FliK [Fictibacillus gelatini]|uniref:flagellar hook-length control protein FliK n=1 Tax=Fictibacillus gelatini TaxID=225985 RepID=UPI0012B5A218|nr:flagellar hook-length control protein FliK [Fictibacillus gelatini]
MKITVPCTMLMSEFIASNSSQNPQAEEFNNALLQALQVSNLNMKDVSTRDAEIPPGQIIVELKKVLGEGDLMLEPKELLMDDAKKLLSLLPKELGEQLEKLFDGTNHAGNVKEDEKGQETVVQLLGLVIHLAYLDLKTIENNRMFQSVGEHIQRELVTHLPFLQKIDQKDSSWGHFLKEIVQQVEQWSQSNHRSIEPNASKENGPFIKVLSSFTSMDGKAGIEGQLKRIDAIHPRLFSSKPASHAMNSRFDSAPMHALEQFVLHVPQYKGDEISERQFVREFNQIISRHQLAILQNGISRFSIQLTPEHLGMLDIQIFSKNGEITARIMTGTQAAKELLESQLHHLKTAFHGSDLQLNKIDIFTSLQDAGYKEQGSFSGRHNRQEQQPSLKDEKNSQDDDQSFIDILDELNIKV